MNEDKSARYHRLQRRASLIGAAATTVLLLVLLASGASEAIREAAAAAAGGSGPLTVVGYVVLVVLLNEAIHLPLAFHRGVTLERRYGLSTQSTGAWCLDHLKAFVLTIGFSVAGALVVWTLMRWSPEQWWWISALVFSVVLVGLAQLAPVVLLPLFFQFKPLERESLVRRLVALAQRAGAQVLGVFEWRISDRTRKANAALAGIGRTRRILLSDTLLAEHSDDEIEVILAHELAHHVYHDIWTSLTLESGRLLLGFYVAHRAMGAAGGWFGVASGDVAGLPIVVLALGTVSVALAPLANAFSRSHERRADRYALRMTRNAAAFSSAMKRLAAQNLAEERPSRLVEVLFYTHPPIAARIAAAQAWANSRENVSGTGR